MIQTEEKDFFRDPTNGALINTNMRALYEYKMRKEERKRLQMLEDDMSLIKGILLELQSCIRELKTGK